MNKQALLPILGILLLANAPSSALSQELTAGDAIRVRPSPSTAPEGRWTEANVLRLTADTLWYESDRSVSPIAMDIADIQIRTDHRVAGAVIGGVTGATVLGLFGHSTWSPTVKKSSDCFIFCDTKPNPVSRGAETAITAALGALVGGWLGFRIGEKLGNWETVELDRITVGDRSLAVIMRIRR